MFERHSAQLKAIFSEFIIDTMNGIMVLDGNDKIIFYSKVVAGIFGLTDSNSLHGKTVTP